MRTTIVSLAALAYIKIASAQTCKAVSPSNELGGSNYLVVRKPDGTSPVQVGVPNTITWDVSVNQR